VNRLVAEVVQVAVERGRVEGVGENVDTRRIARQTEETGGAEA
jgi:hypothetical protein